MLDSNNFFLNDPSNSQIPLENYTQFKFTSLFLTWKRCFDVIGALLLLPVLSIVCLILLVANRRHNPGPLFFVQKRMGQHCAPFSALKFRTMICAEKINRGAFDALEHDRITAFGRFLRRCRLDELPQALNVLRGDMSLIGPRPDFYDHALVYVDAVHGYRERHMVRPGISGYAQVRLGYIEGLEGVRAKVAADLQYISKASILFDLKVTWATIKVVAGRQGM
jgi:lipopolysaccharide/colanic/teichoic acid biosynthesis glycosyltransferase